MAIAVRSAESVWEGSLAAGSGTLGGSDSGVLDGQSVTWEARTEQAGGKTSPEELCAAAHASCFSMALALMLGEAGARPERLAVKAAVDAPPGPCENRPQRTLPRPANARPETNFQPIGLSGDHE